MIRHRQGLPLRFEPGEHLPGVHPRLDDLQRHPALDRFALVGHVGHAHAPFVDFFAIHTIAVAKLKGMNAVNVSQGLEEKIKELRHEVTSRVKRR
jgi:hypothetical protein